MSVDTGFILGVTVMVLGSGAISAFLIWLMARDAKEREHRHNTARHSHGC